MLIACITSGLNDRATSVALPDVRGALGVGYDQGTWIDTAYALGETLGMLIAPWCSYTFSMRYFAVFGAALLGFLGFITPFLPGMDSFIAIRLLQGMSGGFLIPLLMAVALRFLPPGVKLYGLGAYALTAVFGPNLATASAALWTEFVGWQFVYWQAVPLCTIGILLILYGIPQDPLRLERLRQLDWKGLLLGWSSLTCIVIVMEQGERLDWFNSPLICTLALIAVVLFPLFVLNELRHPLPLVRPEFLKRRNFCYGVLTLFTFLIVGMSTSYLPSLYLMEVRDYRPLQIAPAMLWLALPTLVFLPATCFVLNFQRVDARWIAGLGICIIGGCCFAASDLTSAWIGANFYILQFAQSMGQSMLVVSLLMLATSVLAPTDGAFASAIINTMRAIAAPVGTCLMESFITMREHTDSNILLNHAGMFSYTLMQVGSPLAGHLVPLLGDGQERWSGALEHFSAAVQEQALVLAISDTYRLLLGFVALLLLFVIVVPTRAYPPRIAALMQKH
jgi:DHA2 family multidrug resistance protein